MWYVLLAVSVYVGVYTASYGVFEWKRLNRAGAVALWTLSAVALAMPVAGILM